MIETTERDMAEHQIMEVLVDGGLIGVTIIDVESDQRGRLLFRLDREPVGQYTPA
ncbi:MAG: hypothetical protein QME78_00185 [Thermodesulfobacteriota bacterium]|nr:hypothetical protein [Thermodesulfobacteriota bacterium]